MRAIAMAAALAVLCSTLSATAADLPTVAVVKPDLPSSTPETLRRYEAVTDALEDGGIPWVESADSSVASWGLPDVPVAILPGNAGVTDEELSHLRAFLKRPARLIVFHHARNDLAGDLGARSGKLMREVIQGQFHSLHRVADLTTGLPPSLTLSQARVPGLWPTTGQVLCRWRTASGLDANMAGVIVSDRGAVVGAAPSPEHVPQLKLLLRALIGHFEPQLWATLAPSQPRMIGPVGHYGSLTDFSAALERAAGDHLGGSREDVAQAHTLLASVPDLLDEGKQDEAIDAALRAEALSQRAWFRSYPSYDPEIRGVWACDTVDQGWDDAVAKLKAANFNMVFPYMASGAAAYYPSRILPTTPSCNANRLIEAIRAGRRHGVEIHPRILGFFTMGASSELKAQLRAQGRLAQSPSGVDSKWLCPSNHENRLQIIRTALEMVEDFEADGVQFDYLRYSWTDRCVCPTCRARFETESGAEVKNWPNDVLKGAHRERFLDWRRENVTSLLRTVRQKMRDVRPDATLSAAVFINWEGHRDSFGQDWKTWIDEGLVDFVCPMTYMADMEKFQGWVRKQEAWSGGKVPVAMGIGPFADIDPKIDPQGVLDQIQASRKLGCEGFVLFNYQRALAEDYLPLLAVGATSTAAQIPTEARQ
ncbi:MAG: family 10 glycosylhydrolase [Armatimonadia bacterium]|nr:family 10 glycosylhydrolase [Armatimonadia bacterium]